jgi:phosphate starvation-inducible PhoH-like protein
VGQFEAGFTEAASGFGWFIEVQLGFVTHRSHSPQHIDLLAVEGADRLEDDAIGDGLLHLFGEDMLGHDVRLDAQFGAQDVVVVFRTLVHHGLEEQLQVEHGLMPLLAKHIPGIEGRQTLVGVQAVLGHLLLRLEHGFLQLLFGAQVGDAVIVHGTDGKPIRARNKTQEELVKAYFDNDLVFAVGPAGTGKTYIAIALAVRALKNREIKRIILTRPAVEAGERLGFLPGDLKDKLDPYLQPLYDALEDMIPSRKLNEFMADGTIQIAPLAYMRGRTLDRACVILDEAQNTNLGQLKMFLTRMGTSAKFIVTGDATQIDLPRKSDSGLLTGIQLLKGLKGVAAITFRNEDIVRHPLVTKIVRAFDEEENRTRDFEDA